MNANIFSGKIEMTKQTNQKLKSYVVLQYLLKYSSETMLNRE